MSQLSQDATAKLDAAVAAGTMTTEARDAFLKQIETLQFSLDVEKKPPVPLTPPTTPAAPSPEMVQMSQTMSAMNGQLTSFQRKEYAGRIAACLKTSRCTATQAAKLTERANTFQFASDHQTDEVLNAQLEIIEANQPGLLLAAGTVQQMAASLGKTVTTEPNDKFFRDQDIGNEEEIEKIVNGELAAGGYIRPQLVPAGQ